MRLQVRVIAGLLYNFIVVKMKRPNQTHWTEKKLYCFQFLWGYLDYIFFDQTTFLTYSISSSALLLLHPVHCFLHWFFDKGLRLNLRFFPSIFGMAIMPFLCNGTLLFQGNLPRVLPVTIFKYASCLIPYIVSFLILCGEWPSLVLKDLKILLHSTVMVLKHILTNSSLNTK